MGNARQPNSEKVSLPTGRTQAPHGGEALKLQLLLERPREQILPQIPERKGGHHVPAARGTQNPEDKSQAQQVRQDPHSHPVPHAPPKNDGQIRLNSNHHHRTLQEIRGHRRRSRKGVVGTS